MAITKQFSRTVTFIALTLLSLATFAGTPLEDAKQQGLVGEDASGYLGAIGRPTNDIRTLVKTVNDTRREEYERIATANKLDMDAVEQLAGKKTIELTPVGQYVRLPGGDWQKK